MDIKINVGGYENLHLKYPNYNVFSYAYRIVDENELSLGYF